MAVQYANGKIVTSGLVLALDASDKNSYASGSTTWNDLSGNGNSGSLNGSFTFSTNNGGNLLFTAANSNYVTGPLTQGLGTDVTVETFLKIDPSNNPVFYGLATDTYGSGLGIFASSGVWSWNTGDSNSNAFSSSPTIVTTSYYHVVVTNAAASNAKLYINSVLIGTAAYRNATTTGTGNKYEIGAFWQNKSGLIFFINANMGSFKIYNRALSSQEVAQNYNAQKSRFGLT
jgi:hypothetical protein